MARLSFIKIYSFIIIILLFHGLILSAYAESYKEKISRLIENGSYAATKNGRTIFSFNAYTRFVPASIWKLATAFTALETLGKDYHFKTEF
jgi:D-alanyl-D-alanine carboxypeptidase/D-alanyl-D-alanine-endopeptidase (penicillin-binding protein 4)